MGMSLHVNSWIYYIDNFMVGKERFKLWMIQLKTRKNISWVTRFLIMILNLKNIKKNSIRNYYTLCNTTYLKI